MSFSSKIRRFFFDAARGDAAREVRRRQTQREFRRRRLFEELESRRLLAGDGFDSLPDSITLSAGESYHYALEGTDLQIVDQSDVSGLTVSLPTGTQVAFTVTKTSATDGSVSTLGEIVLQLFESEGEAPNSSAQFLYLVESGYYENLSIHRIMTGFMFQGGSSDGAGTAGSGTTIADEHSDVLQHSGRGMVAFANRGSNTSDAQFYVTFDAASWLDGNYNVFGFVVDGYDVVDQLEKAEVTATSGGELSSPVDSYTISNVRVLDSADVDAGVLRVYAEAGTSGSTTISVSGTAADGTTQFKEISIDVVDTDGLLEKIPTSVETTAGETTQVDLPTEYDGSAVTYKVYASSSLENMSIEFLDATCASYKITTTESGAQYVALTVVATLADSGVSATTTQYVFVTPTAPTFEITGSGKLSDGTLVVGSNGVDDALTLSVFTYSDESSVLVKIDGTSYSYTKITDTVDATTGLSTKVIRLTVASYAALADGTHTISVSQYLPVDNVSEHEALYSDATEATLLVDTTALEFVDFPATLSVSANETATATLKTNKTNADGTARSDVAYTLGDDAPDFVSIDGSTLIWNPSDEEAGDYSFSVTATDAAGHIETKTISMSVSSGPRYEISGETTIDEGETFKVTISGIDDEGLFEAPFEFTVSKAPEGLDASTYSLTTSADGTSAVFSWTAAEKDGPGDYEFVVKIVDPDSPDVASYATLTLTVNEVNVAPTIGYDGETTIETDDATPISIQLTPSDADVPAQELTWFFGEETPEWLLIDSNGLLHAENPVAGEYNVEIYLSDGSLTSDPLTLKFVVSETDKPPVFQDLSNTTAKTGETFEATVVATDPNTTKNTIRYALVGDDYPDGFEFNAETGAISWAIPSDYLDSAVSSKTFSFVVKATEQVLGADGETYEDGLSTEKTFEIAIANAAYDESTAKAPVWGEIAAQETTAGESFELTATATAPDGAAGVQYELGDGAPDGMTIDAATGKIAWDVPEDYFSDNSVESTELSITLKATTILTSGDDGEEFGGDATTTFKLTVKNPNYQKPGEDTVYSTWQEWFDAWVANAQSRVDGLAANLSAYLNACVDAVDARDADLAAAASDYQNGNITVSEFVTKKAEIQSTFVQTTTTARSDLATNDAQTETDYANGVADLNSAYEKLDADENFAEPNSIKSEAETAASKVSQSVSTSGSRFTLRNDSNGATISLDLASAMKLWRSGYASSSSIYSEVFSDASFAESSGEETTDETTDETTEDDD